MRTQDLERLLRQLSTPTPPSALKQQCVATIPANVAHNAKSATSTRVKQRELKFAVVALALVVSGLAFWSTRSNEKPGAMHHDGNAAFAQTVEAMRRVTVFHARDEIEVRRTLREPYNLLTGTIPRRGSMPSEASISK
jgi:hypothetical protein